MMRAFNPLDRCLTNTTLDINLFVCTVKNS